MEQQQQQYLGTSSLSSSSTRRNISNRSCSFVAGVGLLGVCLLVGFCYFTEHGPRSARALMMSSWEIASSSSGAASIFVAGAAADGSGSALSSSTGVDPPPNGVFGPSSSSTAAVDRSIRLYTRNEQREFLLTRGRECQQPFASHNPSNDAGVDNNLLLQRFDQLADSDTPYYATELWKYCAIYTGFGQTYIDPSVTTPLILLDDLIGGDDDVEPQPPMKNVAVALESSFKLPVVQMPLHHGFLHCPTTKSKVALGMIRFLLEATNLNPKLLSETLGLFVANDRERHQSSWEIWTARCAQATTTATRHQHHHHGVRYPEVKGVDGGSPCTAQNNRPCCQVYRDDDDKNEQQQPSFPVLSLLHSHLVGTSSAENPLP
jgi:hypothetical protein